METSGPSTNEPIGQGQPKNYFPCPFCKKVLRFNSKLEDHLRVHTKEKPFCCPTCSKVFSAKGTLKEHLLTIHNFERNYKCVICKSAFRSHSELRRHVKNSGLQLQKCTTCNFDCGNFGGWLCQGGPTEFDTGTLLRYTLTNGQEGNHHHQEHFRCIRCSKYFTCLDCTSHNKCGPPGSEFQRPLLNRYCPPCSTHYFTPDMQIGSHTRHYVFNPTSLYEDIPVTPTALFKSMFNAACKAKIPPKPTTTTNNITGNNKRANRRKPKAQTIQATPNDNTQAVGPIDMSIRTYNPIHPGHNGSPNEVDYLLTSSLKGTKM